MKLLLTGAAVATILAAGARAQETVELDEIVFYAETAPVDADRTGATISVITREDIEASGESRVIDVLAKLPGVGVLSRGPAGTLTGITVRGVGQNYVRVLVDGIDVTDPSSPQIAFDFGSLQTADVERIELLRGNQSALYGSEAVGGVINITTTRGKDGLSNRFAVEAGSYGTIRANLATSYNRDGTEAAFTLSRVATDGFSAAEEADGNTEADGYHATRASFSVAREIGITRIGAAGFIERATGDYDEQFPVGDGSPDEHFERKTEGIRVFAEAPLGRIEHSFAASYFRIERRNQGSTAFGPDDNTYTGNRTGLAWRGVLPIEGGRLAVGMDWTRETYDQAGSFGPADGATSIFGVYGEGAYAPTDALDLTATLRHDSHSLAGGETTGRLAGAWRPGEDWTLRASLANGYRAPSQYELNYPFGGNPALKAERSRSFDLGIERNTDRAMLRATLFRTEVDNLIDYVTVDPVNFVSEYRNIDGTVRRQGFEIEGEIRPTDRFTLGGNYTYTDQHDPVISSGNTWNGVFGRHDLTAYFGFDASDNLRARVELQHVAGRNGLPDYTVANATLTYDFTKDAGAYIRVENVFDEQYQLVRGYGTSNRGVFVGLRTHF